MLDESQFKLIDELIRAALTAVDPENVVNNALDLKNSILKIQNQPFDLSEFEHIYLIAFGKASLKMAKRRTMPDDLIGRFITGGIIVSKKNSEIRLPDKYTCLVGGASDPRSKQRKCTKDLKSGERCRESRSDHMLDLRRRVRITDSARERYIVKGYCRPDQAAFGKRSQYPGNQRHPKSHIDRIKEISYSGSTGTDRNFDSFRCDQEFLEAVASGPTVPDSTTYRDCLEIIQKYHLSEKIPAAIYERILIGAGGDIPETLKDDSPILKNISNYLIGDNSTAVSAIVEKGKSLGLNVSVIPKPIIGEAREAGRFGGQF